MREEVELLENHPGFFSNFFNIADIRRQFNPVNNDLPVLVLFQAVNCADEGGLARTGGSEDDDYLTGLDFHIDSAQGMEVAIPFVYIFANNDRFGHLFLLENRSIK